MKILIVDDEIFIQTLAQKILTRDGHETLIADSGFEAVQIFTENADQISLILLDYNLKDINGQTVLKQIRELKPKIPCIFSSGELISEIPDQLSQNTNFLPKPYRANQLIDMVNKIFSDL